MTERHFIVDIFIHRERKVYQSSYENITLSAQYLTSGQSVDNEMSTIHFKSSASTVFAVP